jgi:hypothetical protein
MATLQSGPRACDPVRTPVNHSPIQSAAAPGSTAKKGMTRVSPLATPDAAFPVILAEVSAAGMEDGELIMLCAENRARQVLGRMPVNEQLSAEVLERLPAIEKLLVQEKLRLKCEHKAEQDELSAAGKAARRAVRSELLERIIAATAESDERYEKRLASVEDALAAVTVLQGGLSNGTARREDTVTLLRRVAGNLRVLGECGEPELLLAARRCFDGECSLLGNAAVLKVREKQRHTDRVYAERAALMAKDGAVVRTFSLFVLELTKSFEAEVSALTERIAAALAMLKENSKRKNPYALGCPALPRGGAGWGFFGECGSPGRVSGDWSIHGLKTTFGERRDGVQFNFLSEVFPGAFRTLFPRREELQSAEKDAVDRMIVEYEKKTGERVMLGHDGSLPLHVLLYYLTAEVLKRVS